MPGRFPMARKSGFTAFWWSEIIAWAHRWERLAIARPHLKTCPYLRLATVHGEPVASNAEIQALRRPQKEDNPWPPIGDVMAPRVRLDGGGGGRSA